MSKENKRIQIFYACDTNFVKYTIVSAKSLIENASKKYKYDIHILHTDIKPDVQAQVKELENDNFRFIFDDVTLYLDSMKTKLPIRDYYTKTTYFRLFIAEMYPTISKALYIDSDTIVVGDISELYKTDIKGYYVAAAHEQVMVQTQVYGDYVEKVIGISRHYFFNAGVLLINCREFRRNRVLEQFLVMLRAYSFIVTQDEDYLNVICKGKVRFVGQEWNAETFGKPVVRDSDRKIIHYIMANKPWHYRDCYSEDIFWKYAKMTSVYDVLINERETYPEEKKQKDAELATTLAQKAIDEINKEDNYYNLFVKSTLAPDRVAVTEKIQQYEREGRFDEDVEDDPAADPLLPDQINYLHHGLISKLKTKIAFGAARLFLKDIIRKKKMIIKDINGVENFHSLESGAVITCNHFNAFDSFAMQLAYEAAAQKKKKFYRVIREGNYTGFPGFYGFLMRNCNTLPLSSNFKTMHKFNEAVTELLKKGNYILVYPEQSMWWNYRKPKPLKTGGYSMAVRGGVPVLPCFITMKDSDIMGEDGYYVQEYTIHIGKPIYADPQKKFAENVRDMADANFALWKEIYEREYGVALSYDTEKAVDAPAEDPDEVNV